jgi:hypothetical protein
MGGPVNGGAGRERALDRGRPAAITAPTRLVVRRPRRGWVAGLLGGAVVLIAKVVALVVALTVLAGVTALLWWVGEAQIPVVVIIYGLIVAAGGGFALGRSGRLVGGRSWLPEGPRQLSWEPGISRVQTGVVWEQDEFPVTQFAGQEELPLGWPAEQEDSP